MSLKEVLDTIKSLLVPIGVFLIGKNIAGHQVDENMWQMLLGAVMAVLGLISSLWGHTASVEIIQAGLSTLTKSVMALLFAFGIIKSDNWEVWLPLLGIISQQLYRWQSKIKSRQLDKGKISVDDLKK